MSRIEKLKVLLARVEQRRAEPRLVAVSNASALSSANTNVAAAAARPLPLELAPKPQPSLEQAIAPLAPSSMPPPPSELPSFGSERPAARSSSLPPPARTPLPPPPSSTVPPAGPAATLPGASEVSARAPTEVLPATQLPTRIAPTPVGASDPAVRVTSAPRVETPKTFGELLEQSLALRPRPG